MAKSRCRLVPQRECRGGKVLEILPVKPQSDAVAPALAALMHLSPASDGGFR